MARTPVVLQGFSALVGRRGSRDAGPWTVDYAALFCRAARYGLAFLLVLP